jgi:hypothetical protein
VLPLIRFDDKSLDIDATNHNLQIKSFNNPTSAASATTLADDLQAQSAVQGHVLYRNADGTLEYKTIGQLSGGTVEFVADIDWYVDGSVHQLRKRLRVLNLATGIITDKAGTTYANGWEVAANTTPISQIIGPSQGA